MKLPVWSGKFVLRIATLVAVLLVGVHLMTLSRPVSAVSTTPTTMNFQGRLTNSAGNIMADGLYNMKFRIYDAASAGTLKWSEIRETTNRVQVTNGLFSVQLGQVTPLDPTIFASGSLYFEIELPTPGTATCSTASCGTFTEGPMTPRNKLSTSAYAYNSETLDGLDSSAFALATGGSGYIQNTTTPQTANFSITGTGTAGSLQAASFDTASAGALTIGGTNATSIVLADNVALNAGLGLTITGGVTGTRPASPAEGMMYFDTTTKQLLTYANGKWKAANKTNTVIVAASNSSQNAKDSAEYVADGTADEVEINAAIASLPATGGNVFLLAGTYNVAAPVTLNKTDAVLQGEGRSSQIKRSYNSATAAAFVSVTGTRATLRDLLIDGNKATYSNVNNIGILVDGANSAFLNNFVINNQSYGFDGVFGDSSLISGNDISGGGASAIRLYTSNVLVTNNKIYSNSGYAVQSGDGGRFITVTGNNISSNTGGVRVAGTVSGNRIHSNTNEGVSVLASTSVSGNLISSNGTGISATCADAQKFTLTGNTILASTTIGVYLDCGGGTFGGAVSGNTIADSGNEGIKLNNSANGLTISGNTIQNNGGSGAFSSISLINGPVTNNYITGNLITDTAGTGYAINMNGTSGNYLSGNIYNGTGATTINDTGTNNYSSQMNGSGQLISGASAIKATAANAFQVQNSGATETLFTANTTSNQVKIGNSTASVAADVSLLVLDNAPSTITPTGVAGAMYYDSTNNKFKCYTTAWVDCDTAANGVTTVGAFTGASIANGASISGNTITLGAADGSNPGLVTIGTQTLAGDKTLTGKTTTNDLEVAAGKFLRLNGGTTASRPSTPTEGMVYFDTTTKQLLTYANGKWQAEAKAATLVVAAGGSTQAAKDAAQYVGDGTNDQVAINNAITALPVSGGSVVLLEGTYNISGKITANKANTTLAGQGLSTILKRMYNGAAAGDSVIAVTASNTSIKSVYVDGNKATYTNVNNDNIYMNNVAGDFTLTDSVITNGASAGVNLAGDGSLANVNAKIMNNKISSNTSHGVTNNFSYRAKVTGNQFVSNGCSGYGDSGGNNIVSNNISELNGCAGIALSAPGDQATDNIVRGNASNGIQFSGFASGGSISGNVISGGTVGIYIGGGTTDFIVSSNSISGTSGNGISLDSGTVSSRLNVAGNTIYSAGSASIGTLSTIVDSSITGNVIYDGGGTGAINALNISATRTTIASNKITDTAGTGYAISVAGTGNYLSENTYSGTGATAINDTGTGTIYGAQLNTTQILQSASTLIRGSTSTTLVGTGAISATATITGTGTSFTTDLQVGDQVTINSETRRITAIASNTSATVSNAFTTTASGQTITRLPALLVLSDSTSSAKVVVDNTGALTSSNGITANFTGLNTAIPTDCQYANQINNVVTCAIDANNRGYFSQVTASGNGGFTSNTSTGTNQGFVAKLNGTTNAYIQSNGFASFNGVTSTAATNVQVTSSTAFVVQNGASTAFLTADTGVNNKVQIGSSTPDAATILFVVDSSNSSADPAGVNGAMYYSTTYGQYRCYRDGDWEPCATKPIDRSFILEEEFISGAFAAAGSGIGNLNWVSTALTAGGCGNFAYNGGTGGAAVSADRPGILKLTTAATISAGCRLALGISGANTMMLAPGQVIKASGGLANAAANTATLRIGADGATTAPGQWSGVGNSGVWWEADPTVSANWRYCYINSAGAAACAASGVAIATNVLARLEIKINAVGTNTSNMDFIINGTTSNVSGVTLNTTGTVRPDILCSAQVAVAQGCYADYYMIRGDATAAR